MSTSKKRTKKPAAKSYWLGRSVFFLISVAVGLVGAAGWYVTGGLQGYVFTGLQLATIPAITLAAGLLGRSRESWVALATLAICMGWSAFSISHAYDTLIEKPAHEAHVASIAPVKAEWDAAAARVTVAEQALDTQAPLPAAEVLTCLCPKTREATAAARAALVAEWNAERVRLETDVAKAETKAAEKKAAYDTALASREPVNHALLHTFAGLIDLVLALTIWAYERTAHREKLAAEAKAEAERKAREKRKAQAPVVRKVRKAKTSGVVTAEEAAFLAEARGPGLRLVVNND